MTLPQTRSKRAAILFACVWCAYAVAPVSVQGDSRWTVPTALSFLHGQGGDLRAYLPALTASAFYAIECVESDHTRRFPIQSSADCPSGRFYHFHPVAVALLAMPFVAALETGRHLAERPLAWLDRRIARPGLRALFAGDLAGASAIVENLISAVFTAAAVAVLYLAALEFLPSGAALALALIFAFGTLLWSLVSRALWQHSPSIFLNSLLILLLLRAGQTRRAWLAIGFVLALAFFIRPSNAVTVLVIGACLIVRLRARALWVVAGGAPLTAAFILLNLHMYASPIAPFFWPVRAGASRLAFSPSIAAALLGNLVSPARGLFVFMPFFLFLFVPQIWREPMPAPFARLRPWFCGLVGLYLLLVAMHTDWWGGFSYGPRYLSDVLPYLMFLWSPVLLWMAGRGRRAAVYATLAISLVIQFRGATSIETHRWNSIPDNVSRHTSRIWDWTDPPFLRGLR